MSIPYIISAVLSPPLGLFVDRFGFRAVISAISPALILVVHMLMAKTEIDCIYPLIGQGLAYTVAFYLIIKMSLMISSQLIVSILVSRASCRFCGLRFRWSLKNA